MITHDLFAPLVEALGPFTPHPRFGVAVSGGADSLCLAFLLQAWVKEKKGRLFAAIVDHRLRSTSTEEAEETAALLTTHQIETVILPWNDLKPATGIQRKAREARYHLLTTWCRQQGVPYLFLAHHADDQLETVLMREACGSYAYGLAGMSACVFHRGIRLLRPLLSVSRASLQAFLKTNHIPWIDDPSNHDPKFTRSHIRQRCAALSVEEKEAYQEKINAYGLLRQQDERQAQHFLEESTTFFPEGYAHVHLVPFLKASLSYQKLILRSVLRGVRGREKFLKNHQIDRLLTALKDGSLARGQTINGCFLKITAGHLMVCREPGHQEELYLTPGHPLEILWDQRFVVRFQARFSSPILLKALGKHGVAFLRKHVFFSNRPWGCLPLPVLLSLPALWVENMPQEIPHLNLRFSLQNAVVHQHSTIDRIAEKMLHVEQVAVNSSFLLV